MDVHIVNKSLVYLNAELKATVSVLFRANPATDKIEAFCVTRRVV